MERPALEPILGEGELIWSSGSGTRFILSVTEGECGELRVSNRPSRDDDLEALRSLPHETAMLPAWILRFGRAEAIAVHTALLRLLDRCLETHGRDRTIEAGGAFLRLQLLAGLARGRPAAKNLASFLRELARLVQEDRTFLSGRDLEMDLLTVVEPGDTLALLRLEVDILQQIDDWLSLRFAWRALLRFRRWCRRATRAWVGSSRQAREAEIKAEREGDLFAEELSGLEAQALLRTPRGLDPHGAGVALKRWRRDVTSPWLLTLLLAAPFATLAALATFPRLAIPPLLGILWGVWILAAIVTAHRLLSNHPMLLWGGGAGGLIVLIAAALLKDSPTPLSGAQTAISAITACLVALVLSTRLPRYLSVRDRLRRVIPLLVLVGAFHAGLVLILVCIAASSRPGWAAPLHAAQLAAGKLVLLMPVSLAAVIALGATTGALGAATLSFKDPGPLILQGSSLPG